jgi:hypothetical protein
MTSTEDDDSHLIPAPYLLDPAHSEVDPFDQFDPAVHPTRPSESDESDLEEPSVNVPRVSGLEREGNTDEAEWTAANDAVNAASDDHEEIVDVAPAQAKEEESTWTALENQSDHLDGDQAPVDSSSSRPEHRDPFRRGGGVFGRVVPPLPSKPKHPKPTHQPNFWETDLDDSIRSSLDSEWGMAKSGAEERPTESQDFNFFHTDHQEQEATVASNHHMEDAPPHVDPYPHPDPLSFSEASSSGTGTETGEKPYSFVPKSKGLVFGGGMIATAELRQSPAFEEVEGGGLLHGDSRSFSASFAVGDHSLEAQRVGVSPVSGRSLTPAVPTPVGVVPAPPDENQFQVAFTWEASQPLTSRLASKPAKVIDITQNSEALLRGLTSELLSAKRADRGASEPLTTATVGAEDATWQRKPGRREHYSKQLVDFYYAVSRRASSVTQSHDHMNSSMCAKCGLPRMGELASHAQAAALPTAARAGEWLELKLKGIPTILEHFYGTEEDMFRLLRFKYNDPCYPFRHYKN